MNFFKRLFTKKVEREPRQGQSKSASGIDFGIFLFNSSDQGISGNYALHAKMAVSKRVAERDKRVRDESWPVLSGDLFGTGFLQAALDTAGISPDATRLDSSLLETFGKCQTPEYILYVIGIFMCPLDALIHADKCMKQDGIAGYLGLATFVLPHEDVLREFSKGMSLPITKLHSIDL